MDTPGFIKPPPGLIPPRDDTDTRTARVPNGARQLPVFKPPTAAAGPTAAVPRAEQIIVVLPTGARLPIEGPNLFGRNPVRFGTWESAELVAIDDPARSVSKTHAALEPVDGGVRVTDLHSTNGVTVVAAGGAASRIGAGTSVTVAAGGAIRLGDYELTVTTISG